KAGSGSGGGRRGDSRYLDVIRERPIRVTVKVLVPVREHPKGEKEWEEGDEFDGVV
ncbi:hypothetical protein Pcinc_036782, partial [Petrolisthes cinctipes]